MKDNPKNIKQWGIVILSAVVLFWALFNLETVGNILNRIFTILLPFIIGSFIALILNIPMKFFERKFAGKNDKKTPRKRILALLLSVIIIIAIVAAVVLLIVPELIKIVALLIDNIPYYQQGLNEFLVNLQEKHSWANLDNIKNMLNIDFETIKNALMTGMSDLVASSFQIVQGIIGGVISFAIGLVFAFYMLIEKDRLKSQGKKIMITYFKSKGNIIISTAKRAVNTFNNFISAQCLDATIWGVLSVIGLLILQIPYAVPIGILIGVCAMIPMIGVFIGMAIGAILIISISPIKVVVFLIFVIILQQIDGNIIYPRVVGNRIGLPGIWVLFAIIVGANIMGVLGMLISIPVASLIYAMINERINRKQTVPDVINSTEDIKNGKTEKNNQN